MAEILVCKKCERSNVIPLYQIAPGQHLCGECSNKPSAETPHDRDTWQTVAMIAPARDESQTANLIRSDRDAWLRRSNKWHSILDRERRWLARGIAAPVVIGAAGTLIAAVIGIWFKGALGYLPLVSGLALFIGGLIGWRANMARMQLDTGKIDECWVIADTMWRQYNGIVARLDDGEPAAQFFHTRQTMEAGARFGLPESVRQALDTANKVQR